MIFFPWPTQAGGLSIGGTGETPAPELRGRLLFWRGSQLTGLQDQFQKKSCWLGGIRASFILPICSPFPRLSQHGARSPDLPEDTLPLPVPDQLQLPYLPVAQPEREEPNRSERAVEELPEERDLPERSGDQCHRQHQPAGDQAELDHPNVADRVAEGSDESYGNHQMGKGKPVGAVGEEGEGRANPNNIRSSYTTSPSAIF